MFLHLSTDSVDSPRSVRSLSHIFHLPDPQRRVAAGRHAEPAVRGCARPARRPLLHGSGLLHEERSSGTSQQRQEEELESRTIHTQERAFLFEGE